MSIIKFNLTKEHIALIKAIDWKTIAFPHLKQEVNTNTPFTNGESITQDIGLILFGKRYDEITPEHKEDVKYSQEEITHMKKLYEELPLALSICLYCNDFEPGEYKTKSYLREWTKIN